MFYRCLAYSVELLHIIGSSKRKNIGTKKALINLEVYREDGAKGLLLINLGLSASSVMTRGRQLITYLFLYYILLVFFNCYNK